jgi:hypothetical protein
VALFNLDTWCTDHVITVWFGEAGHGLVVITRTDLAGVLEERLDRWVGTTEVLVYHIINIGNDGNVGPGGTFFERLAGIKPSIELRRRRGNVCCILIG